MAILVFILLLSVLVIVHELGHYFAARRRGITVEEFGFGYPPRLWRLFRYRGTDFSLNAIPFGGFVRLEGEEYDPAAAEVRPSPTAFYAQRAWSRIAVIAAGPIANILFGIAAFSVVFGVIGVPRSLEGRPRVEEIAAGSPAETAGIVPDEEITGFRLGEVFTATPQTTDVMEFVSVNRGQTVTAVLTGPCEQLTCQEIQKETEVYIRTEAETPAGQGAMGVAFADYYFETGPWYLRLSRGIVYGFTQAVTLGVLIIGAVWQLLRDLILGGQVPAEIAGPVGIVHQATEYGLLSRGWPALTEFAGMLSINLGIMNALPIPALDGGRILFILLERVIGKRRIQSIEGYVHYGGFILLLGLIILVSLRDIAQIFRS